MKKKGITVVNFINNKRTEAIVPICISIYMRLWDGHNGNFY